MQKLICDRRSQFVAVLDGNQIEHEVQRCRTAGAGIALTIDLEDFGCDFDVGEQFREGGQVFPVDGASVPIEEAGLREDKGTRTDRTDLQTL